MFAALCALASLLFMQLAVAGYVCPGSTVDDKQEMHALADLADCQGMDMDQANLCQAYAQAGNYSLDKPNLPQVQGFIAATLTLVLFEVEVAADEAVRVPPMASSLTRATAPPLAIRNCCFRI